MNDIKSYYGTVIENEDQKVKESAISLDDILIGILSLFLAD